MKVNSGLKIVVVIAGLLFTSLFSCRSDSSQSADTGLWYFPAKNIYYDAGESLYYYSLDGGVTWDSMSYAGGNYGVALGNKVPVERVGNKEIWLDNDLHRKQHNGGLLNLVNNQTIAIYKADSISKIKRVTPVVAKPKIVQKEQPPEKKGLKKFFDKLFGKKKKPEEEKK